MKEQKASKKAKQPTAQQLRTPDRTPHIEQLRAAVLPPLERYEHDLQIYLATPKQPLRVLSVDPGTTNIALCFLDIEHEGVLTSKIEAPNLLSPAANVLYRERIIEHWIRMFKPDVIFKEGVAHGMQHGVAEAGRLQYIVERLAIEYNIPMVTVNNGTMRKYVGASGNAKESKSSTKLKVFQKWGMEFGSEDETDAFAIAKTGIAIVTGEVTVNGVRKAK